MELSTSEYFQQREEGESKDYISRETLIQMNEITRKAPNTLIHLQIFRQLDIIM